MNILNLPGWEVTGHTQTKTDYRIEAVYTPEPTACPECSTFTSSARTADVGHR